MEKFPAEVSDDSDDDLKPALSFLATSNQPLVISSDSEPDNNTIINEVDVEILTIDTIINILLCKPAEFEAKERPRGIRKNFMCTLNKRKVSLELARSDDNGAFLKKGSPNKLYHVIIKGNDVTSIPVHGVNGSFYINERLSLDKDLDGTVAGIIGAQYQRAYVPTDSVYEVTKQYRKSKSNEYFSNVIVTIRKATEPDIKDYYIFMYRYNDSGGDAFIEERHGNAKKAHAPIYQRQNPEMLKEARSMLQKGQSCSQTYNSIIKTSEKSSDAPRNPKVIHNLNHHVKEKPDTDGLPECESLVKQMRETDFTSSVVMLPEHYISFHARPYIFKDLERFCVSGSCVFSIDTTFELTEGLWLTDSSYKNMSLLNEKNEHPDFPGPFMWCFKKNRSAYRRFAVECVAAHPPLVHVQEIGMDMDEAISNGLSDVFVNAEKLYCMQHLQEADVRKLKSIGANKSIIGRIMGDVYGVHKNMMEFGLVDCEDEEEFESKLSNLKSVWEGLVPGYHSWFVTHRSEKLRNNMIVSARRTLGVSGRYFSNGLELAHKLQKKMIHEETGGKKAQTVVEANNILNEWVDEFHRETIRAIRGVGKYRLANGYENFYMAPIKWDRLSLARQQQHIQSFLNFTPSESQKYVKPKSAGLKATPPSKKRRVNMPEPTVFNERTSSSNVATPVTPLVLSRQSSSQAGCSGTWEVVSNKLPHALDPLNPDCLATKAYVLVHREDSKNCPKSVKRCQGCKRMFTENDLVAVKTEGDRQWTDESGKARSYRGNIYLHYLTKCLTDFDQHFKFENISVPQAIQQRLPTNSVEKLKEKGCKLVK